MIVQRVLLLWLASLTLQYEYEVPDELEECKGIIEF